MTEYYVWLQLCLGFANSRIHQILNRFENPENIYLSDNNERQKSGLFTFKELKKLQDITIDNARKIIDECKNNSINLIVIGSLMYPICLSVLDNSPIVIYIKGNMPDFDNYPSICIVGPRKVSDFGKKAAFSLGYRLAKSGFTIVSGGALGSDTYAHMGAIRAEGKTTIVMGCGINSNYLSENKLLRDSAQINGCLLTEYPPDIPPSKYSFPIRNRIMSALSLGTIVVEAGLKSGAMITANHAIDQGKDVFVIPGSLNAKEYSGSNTLLRDGAKPLLDISDIFNEYIGRFSDKINIKRALEKINKPDKQKKSDETLSNEAKIVYNHLDNQKFYPDDIKNTGLDSEKILSCLIELEIEYKIRSLPGGMYEKIDR